MKTKTTPTLVLIRRGAIALLLSTLNTQLSTLNAQSTAFTYQGRLTERGAPATGAYDLRCVLYDAVQGGTVLGATNALAAVPVTNGLFTVHLDFGDAAFVGGGVRWVELAVRTNGGTGNYSTLAPRQPLTPTPMALYASLAGTAYNVVGGRVGTAALGDGAVTGRKIASGQVVRSVNGLTDVVAITAGANVTVTPSGNSLRISATDQGGLPPGQAGVPSGGIVLSATENSTLVNAGYVKIGTVQTGDSWQERSNGSPPSPRFTHTAVWTGSEMIVWGGENGTIPFNDGSRYNPAANTWTAVPTTGAPAPVARHTAVWTGSEMIVWGGYLLTEFGVFQLNSGGRYNPIANSWSPVSSVAAPVGRSLHTAVWTGSEMIVWGGLGAGDSNLNDGGRYNPVSDSWEGMPIAGAPAARFGHTAVWTGDALIVWGGAQAPDVPLGDGARYQPATAGWSEVTLTGAPAARFGHTAVWTGHEMIVWGGAGNLTAWNDGGRYDPAVNGWTSVPTAGAPSARRSHTAVWTGSELIVWGGQGASSALNDGGRFNPAENLWRTVSTSGAPSPRLLPTAVWTGREMIVWGGNIGEPLASALNDGGRYNPSVNTWTVVSTTGAPTVRDWNTAVWTGSEMIVWGGHGGRYNPAANAWTSVPTAGAPTPRDLHTAVWTGNEMIVWGGDGGIGLRNDGGRFDPAANMWTAVPTTAAPVARMLHTAVWTGREMVVWGGQGSDGVLNDGGRFDPAANTWTSVPTAGAPTPRDHHTAVWTGKEMIVWGGRGIGMSGEFVLHNDGGRFNPAANQWTAVSTDSGLAGRREHTAVWTGAEMIVWGGLGGTNDGSRFDPAANTWGRISTIGAPTRRYMHAAVWTGAEMIVWAGWSGGDWSEDGGRFNPAANTWLPVRTTRYPAQGRESVVWTGSEMLAWDRRLWSYTPGKVMFLYQKP